MYTYTLSKYSVVVLRIYVGMGCIIMYIHTYMRQCTVYSTSYNKVMGAMYIYNILLGAGVVPVHYDQGPNSSTIVLVGKHHKSTQRLECVYRGG